jgi:CBS domain-containing protein
MQIEERIKVVEVMALDMDSPVVLDEACPLHEVIQQLNDSNSGCALLTLGGRLTGIFTERDLVVRVMGRAHPVDQTVAEYMTSNPDSVSPTDPIRKAVRLMQRGGFRSVPVVDKENRVVGCVRHSSAACGTRTSSSTWRSISRHRYSTCHPTPNGLHSNGKAADR